MTNECPKYDHSAFYVQISVKMVRISNELASKRAIGPHSYVTYVTVKNVYRRDIPKYHRKVLNYGRFAINFDRFDNL